MVPVLDERHLRLALNTLDLREGATLDEPVDFEEAPRHLVDENEVGIAEHDFFDALVICGRAEPNVGFLHEEKLPGFKVIAVQNAPKFARLPAQLYSLADENSSVDN